MTVPLPFVGMCAESFIYSLANAVLSSVAQGLQPLWGNSYGKQDTKEINDYFRFGITVSLVLSVLVSAGLVRIQSIDGFYPVLYSHGFKSGLHLTALFYEVNC